ncbi:MAG: aspartate aminotransferase family protein [Flavobacteriaceae bacterium]|nr:MAG: aspartate aminotransferase family protein [Flavobacteriaceae bacterium]
MAKGSYLYDNVGNSYLDFAAGVSANTLGHSHPAIVSAIKEQAEKYLHVMVYGEYALSPAVELCKKIDQITPDNLQSTYLLNSGAEAIDASLKLAKRLTGRRKIMAFKGAYHGNTHGALSVSDSKIHKEAYGPLLEGISTLEFNNFEDLDKIDDSFACVLIETIQGASGFILPKEGYLLALKERCLSMGVKLIYDEIQPGFGRTGTWFAFQNEGVNPDILVLGKGMGAGLPIGAIVASRQDMAAFSVAPKLGHITTFGGNPLVAAASLAMIQTMEEEKTMEKIAQKEALFRKLLLHPKIKSFPGKGLMLALEMESEAQCMQVANKCMEKGLIVFWLLYQTQFIRITPPLNISDEEIKKGCQILLTVLDEI